jgi:hypothetical protein
LKTHGTGGANSVLTNNRKEKRNIADMLNSSFISDANNMKLISKRNSLGWINDSALSRKTGKRYLKSRNGERERYTKSTLIKAPQHSPHTMCPPSRN